MSNVPYRLQVWVCFLTLWVWIGTWKGPTLVGIQSLSLGAKSVWTPQSTGAAITALPSWRDNEHSADSRGKISGVCTQSHSGQSPCESGLDFSPWNPESISAPLRLSLSVSALCRSGWLFFSLVFRTKINSVYASGSLYTHVCLSVSVPYFLCLPLSVSLLSLQMHYLQQ